MKTLHQNQLSESFGLFFLNLVDGEVTIGVSYIKKKTKS